MAPLLGLRPMEFVIAVAVFATAALIDTRRGISLGNSKKRLLVYAVVIVVGVLVLGNFVELRNVQVTR